MEFVAISQSLGITRQHTTVAIAVHAPGDPVNAAGRPAFLRDQAGTTRNGVSWALDRRCPSSQAISLSGIVRSQLGMAAAVFSAVCSTTARLSAHKASQPQRAFHHSFRAVQRRTMSVQAAGGCWQPTALRKLRC
jgi:hypothetical protein